MGFVGWVSENTSLKIVFVLDFYKPKLIKIVLRSMFYFKVGIIANRSFKVKRFWLMSC